MAEVEANTKTENSYNEESGVTIIIFGGGLPNWGNRLIYGGFVDSYGNFSSCDNCRCEEYENNHKLAFWWLYLNLPRIKTMIICSHENDAFSTYSAYYHALSHSFLHYRAICCHYTTTTMSHLLLGSSSQQSVPYTAWTYPWIYGLYYMQYSDDVEAESCCRQGPRFPTKSCCLSMSFSLCHSFLPLMLLPSTAPLLVDLEGCKGWPWSLLHGWGCDMRSTVLIMVSVYLCCYVTTGYNLKSNYFSLPPPPWLSLSLGMGFTPMLLSLCSVAESRGYLCSGVKCFCLNTTVIFVHFWPMLKYVQIFHSKGGRIDAFESP